jgi:DNA-binding Lrp family transcriptional regulator
MKMDRLLKLLDTNARLSNAQLAVMLNTTEQDVARQIAELEQSGVVRAYKALIDWERTDREYVTAVIELRVMPKRDFGFEAIAETIMRFEEVESVYLMSGGYDLLVTVTGRTFKDVSMFVAKRLSTLDSVLSTATHFVLRRYKESGVMFLAEEQDQRGAL